MRASSRPGGRATVVLIVDDEAQLRRSAARILNANGFETLLAANGREAIEIFRDRGESISAVLLDMAMPELGGKQTFSELRRLRSDVCVILSSGYDEVEAIHRFDSAGLAGFLQKPYSAAELVSCIRDAMARAAASDLR
jgi:two-component system, cell cycle sensor histidine kinase and response regulator CckA